MKKLPSPNFSSRDGAAISMLVLHYTGMKSAQDALNRLRDEKAKVSSHYVVDEDGTVYALVDEAHCAWHAGVSYWRGRKNINTVSVGVEIVNPGHEHGYRAFPPAQMEAVAKLSGDIIKRHGIKPVNVVGHSDIAPQRKTDPGELFDWQWLAGRGIGLWPEKTESKSPVQKNIALKLASYGYEIPHENEDISKVIEAFQRHFRPQRLNGVWDEECDQMLAGLLTMI